MILLNIFVFIFGSLIGSFLNVVIYRVPRNQSVVHPRSSCPSCKHKISWYENIPILSYLVLRGKCRECKTKISLKYPLIELIVGLIAVVLFPSEISSTSLWIYSYYFSVACVLLAQLFIDIEHQLLPDKINIYFLAITIPYVVLNLPLFHWLVGGIIGFFIPLIVTWGFYKLRGQIGLGGGDIKIFGILGLLLGPLGIVHNIFMSCALGALVGIILIVLKKLDKNTPMAFGPFIIIVAAMQIFYPSIFELINPFSIY